VKPRRSKLARDAEAIAGYRESESWRRHEIHAAVAELDQDRSVPHAAVVKWLRSWGKSHERKAPRA
jgi:predicted transcriptional regulator